MNKVVKILLLWTVGLLFTSCLTTKDLIYLQNNYSKCIPPFTFSLIFFKDSSVINNNLSLSVSTRLQPAKIDIHNISKQTKKPVNFFFIFSPLHNYKHILTYLAKKVQANLSGL